MQHKHTATHQSCCQMPVKISQALACHSANLKPECKRIVKSLLTDNARCRRTGLQAHAARRELPAAAAVARPLHAHPMIVKQQVVAIGVWVQAHMQQRGWHIALVGDDQLPRVELCSILEPRLHRCCMQHALQPTRECCARSKLCIKGRWLSLA